MAVYLNSQPVDYIAAYKPMLCGYRSNKFPVNLTPGTSNLPISSIAKPAAPELAAYPALEPNDVVVQYTAAAGSIRLGMLITIKDTDEGAYVGNYRVIKFLFDGYVVIDAAYTEDDSGGTLSRYFERYTMIAEVRFSGLTKAVFMDFKSDDKADFIVDLRDIAQRGFKDLLSDENMRPGLTTPVIVEADGLITQTYSIAVWEGYMEPDTTGINRFVEFRKEEEVVLLNKICVNAVQPYHETTIQGNVTLAWQDDLVAYLVNENSTGRDAGRFLTYAPRKGQTVREADDVFLAFLWNGGREQVFKVIRTYDRDGNLLDTDRELFYPPTLSGVWRCGPVNLGAVITNDTHTYEVEFQQNNELVGVPITETFTFTMDRKCVEQSIRPTALNPLGGADGITMNVRENDGIQVERSTVSKPDMAVDYSPTWTGDYNRRTWAIQMAKTYEANSEPQTAEIRKWFGESIFPSPDVRIEVKPGIWTPVIITTRTLNTYTSEKRPGVIRFGFVLGVDNVRQRR